MSDLFQPVSLVHILREIDSGRLSAQAAIGECVDCIRAHDDRVGAFEWLSDDARNNALNHGAGPLGGLPIGVKDIIDTAGIPTRHGSPIWTDNVPLADAAVVAMARRAGAAILGKTVTTEFAFFHPGKTTNPHNPDHTPGGSSSGSAAAVAAGMVPMAIGTQTGGSVIRPASFCGIAGYKPSFRLVPTIGVKCFSWALDTVGFFAATVEDVAFLTEAVTGRALRIDGRSHSAPRIGICRTHKWDEAELEMQAALERASKSAEKAGAVIVDVDPPKIFATAFAAHTIIQDHEAARALAWEFDNHRDELSDELLPALEHGWSIPVSEYDNARRTANHARKATKDLFTENGIDVILTPSAPGAAPRGLESTGSSIFNRLWTLLGVPCVNVPGIWNEAGLPLGVQIVAPFGQDRRSLEAARFLEANL